MLGILWDALLALLRGEGLGFRLRIKPSWSGRVYGTYHLTARHFALAALSVGSVSLLFGRLVAMNLAEVSPDPETGTLRRTRAHALAAREILLPSALGRLEGKSSDLFALAHQISTILGMERGATGGLGRAGELESVPAESGPAGADPLRKIAEEVEMLEASFDRLGAELQSHEAEFRFMPTIAPVFQAEFVPTSTFGPRLSPFTNLPEIHRGQDLAADLYAKIVATADGVVVAAERDASKSRMGRYVVIDHGGRYQTYYGHCERLFVEVGESIKRHQIIAEVGSTGRSTGPHVHYEVRIAGNPKDPRHFMVFDPHFNSEDQARFE